MSGECTEASPPRPRHNPGGGGDAGPWEMRGFQSKQRERTRGTHHLLLLPDLTRRAEVLRAVAWTTTRVGVGHSQVPRSLIGGRLGVVMVVVVVGRADLHPPAH